MASTYPFPGCIVEFLEDNAVHIGMVIEDSGGKLRLLLPNRREIKISAARLLPWIGPSYQPGMPKEEIVRILDQHMQERENKAKEIRLSEAWELTQGEMKSASAAWFAELMEKSPSDDDISAYGRTLLFAKTHFKFEPPDFRIYDKATVEKKEAEAAAKQEKELLAAQGNAFIRLLWDVANKKRVLPPPQDSAFPPENLAERIRQMLFNRMAEPDTQQDETLWQLISKGLPDEPNIPVRLLIAWNILPRHYNFWLDRADFEPGDDWWRNSDKDVKNLIAICDNGNDLEPSERQYLSIDGISTKDIDDAFHIQKTDTGWDISLAFANPALAWPFGSQLDKKVSHRAISIYLPEGDLHMLPEILGTDAYSLLEKKERPALILDLKLNEDGECLECTPSFSKIKVAANLRYGDVQRVIAKDAPADNPALPYADEIMEAHRLALARENLRIRHGAIIMMRKEPEIILQHNDDDIQVNLTPETPAKDSKRLISELMILASSAIADWATEKNIPFLYRTQNVTVPKEYAGIWERPEDLAMIMHSLIPSSLETTPRPHAALGLARYAQVTSPLRRYSDLVNEAQLIHYIQEGAPRWGRDALEEIANAAVLCMEGASHVQRFRPRYWKLLFFRQQGEHKWYDGIITKENENTVTVALVEENIMVRGRRSQFDDRAAPGMNVRIRLGKVNPLMNEIHILEARSEE